MSDTPPAVGQDPWGNDLNAYLAALESKIDAQDLLMASLEDRITDLEARPEHVYESFSWMYSNQAPPPTGSQVRFDNANLALATQAVFRLIDNDGADRTQVFRMVNAGSQIRITDWDNVDQLHRFNVTGPAVIGATDASVPVSWISGSGTIPNAKANVAFLVILVL